MGLTRYPLKAGERRTIRVPFTRTGDTPAESLWFRWSGVWHQVDPEDSTENPARYPITFAAGEPATGTHPEGTHVLTDPVQVEVLLPAGSDLVVQPVAWIAVP